MPIEELARRTGMTVRNIRALQARAILGPPELQGRKGFYTERHVARVGLVTRLQGRGFSLASIAALIEGWEAGSGLLDVMGLEDALRTPGTDGARTEADIAEEFPELLGNPRALKKALEQELVIRRKGRIVAPNAELLDIVRQEVATGYPLEALLEEADELLADVERIAARFRQSFFKHFVDAHLASGTSGAALPGLAEKVAILRPLSVRAVSLLLARAIERGGGIAERPPRVPRRRR
jgi:DNA-binding transcriptional MerR regulator